MVIFPTANITEIFYIKLKDVDNQLIWLYDKEDALNDFHKAVNDVFNILLLPIIMRKQRNSINLV